MLASALHTHATQADSRLCLSCHDDLGASALFAHSLEPEQLAGRTLHARRAKQQSEPPSILQFASLTGSSPKTHAIACSSCHREHHGRSSDLKTLSDTQCQNCHAKQFHSFGRGHPDFGDFPHKRRTRIYFDHALHFQKYFAEAEFQRLMPDGAPPSSCTSCHAADPTGGMMRTRGFDQSCAGCHESEIVDVDFPGIPFFALPRLPSSSPLPGANAMPSSVGEWPASDSIAGELPAFMRLLLRNDEMFQSVRQALVVEGRQLMRVDAEHQEVAVSFSLAIKQLLHDVAQNGDVALTDRLGGEFSDFAFLSALIAPSLREATHAWFPNLQSEIEAIAADQSLPKPEATVTSRGQRASTGLGWYVSHHDRTIRYRPIGHEDPLLQTLLERVTARLRYPNSSESDTLWSLHNLLSNPSASGSITSNGPIASGRCLACHTTDNTSLDGELRVNWHARRPGSMVRPFTRFEHAPHILSADGDSCETCHQLETGRRDNADTFRLEFFERDANQLWHQTTDPNHILTSGFQAVTRSNCRTCHNQTQASQSCVECHNYHASGSSHGGAHVDGEP